MEYIKAISHTVGSLTNNSYPYSSDDDDEYIDKSQVYVLFV